VAAAATATRFTPVPAATATRFTPAAATSAHSFSILRLDGG